MAYDVAVFVGKDGSTVSVSEAGTWKIYRENNSVWQEIRKLQIFIDKSAGLFNLRQQMASIVEFLGDCRIVVALAVNGIPFFEFEKAGCNVWEFKGLPKDFLDYVISEEFALKQTKALSAKAALIPQPEDLGDGHFRVSIKEIQKKNSAITSKQILQEFLQQGKFYSLDIICSHIPPWLECEVLLKNYQVTTVKRSQQDMTLTLVKPSCTGHAPVL